MNDRLRHIEEWRVNITDVRTGRRVSRNFATREEAEAFAENYRFDETPSAEKPEANPATTEANTAEKGDAQ